MRFWAQERQAFRGHQHLDAARHPALAPDQAGALRVRAPSGARMRFAQLETGAFISVSVCAIIITNLRCLRLFGLLARTGNGEVPTALDSHHAKPEAQRRPDDRRRG